MTYRAGAGGATGWAAEPARGDHQRFADFTVLEQIGTGGATTVHRAVHRAVGVEVALKVWQSRLTPTQREQYLHECRLQWKMSDHPHIVRLLWAGAPDDGSPWIASELYAESLAGRLRTGPPLTAAEKRTVASDLLDGLAAIHRSGLLHRDVKPANVMLDGGRAALGDFGIAVPAAGSPSDPAAGSELYLAPEVAGGAAPSARADVFSAAMTIRAMHVQPPARLEDLLTRAGSYRPADRPPEAGEFLVLLREADPAPAATDPVSATARTASGSSSGAVAAAGAGAVSGTWSGRGRHPGRWRGVRAGLALFVGALLAVVLGHGWESLPGMGATPTADLVLPAAPSGVLIGPAPVAGGAADVRWSHGLDGIEQLTATASVVGGTRPAVACTARPPAAGCRLIGLTDGVTYTVTVVATNALGSSPPSRAFRVISRPAIMTGPHLVLWLDGADPATRFESASCSGESATGLVGCWADKSPRRNNAAQSAIAARPTLAVAPAPAAVSFGGRQSLSLVRSDALPAGATPSTTFVTAMPQRPVIGPARVAMSWGTGRGGGQGRVFGRAAGSRTAVVGEGVVQVESGRWALDSMAVLVGEHTADAVRGRVDGVDGPAELASVDTPGTTAYVGRDAEGSDWRGAVGEIIVFDRLLSGAERASVEAYLNRKWDVGEP